MYTSFFNLREVPFSIAPDPAYLYMSPRHQEALGHLLYGTGQYGGFVQLTGEVGTGKTTIVRTLLAQKLQNVDVAMIHNPRQSEQEFVQSICDELGVSYVKAGATLKVLVDALNAFLLEQHAAGRRTVLIIDEAQQLAPAVLEQVRLLTNLETTKEKLLRIMLIGQPELAELLGRQDLRQLAQRITARYHLTPLDAAETGEYIAHRLQVAGGARDLFAPAATKLIHKHSGGVPRLVNVLCDRALLGAYARGVRQVGPDIVQAAAAEVLGVVATRRRSRLASLKLPVPSLRTLEISLAAIGLVVAGLLLREHWPVADAASASAAGTSSELAGAEPVKTTTPAAADVASPAAPQVLVAPAPTTPKPVVASAAGSSVTAPAPVQALAPAPVAAGGLNLAAASAPLNNLMLRLGRLWVSEFRPGSEKACRALRRLRLECLKGNAEWSDLAAMNQPAILTLQVNGELRYVLLRELGREQATLLGEKGKQRVPLTALDPLWTGEYLLVWKRETDETVIGPEIRGEPILWLRQRLGERLKTTVGIATDDRWDAELREAVQRYQTINGIRPDGIAGPRTLLALADRRNAPQLSPRP